MTRFNGNWDTGQRRNFRRILVVGGGRAGVAAAEELRRQGFGGEVVVMYDEPEPPYDRPSCSKSILTGHKRPRDARMPVQEDLAIQWELGVRAVHLDPVDRVVYGDNDQKYPYDGLVIASGAHPVWPKGWPPRDEPGLYPLYGIRDAWALRKALQWAKRVAVVGGGITGCEVACSVRKMARQCVLIDSKQQVMSRALGEVVGRYVTEEVAADGVELRLGRRVNALERKRRRWVLILDDGSEVEADVVVASIGERPDTRWLEGSGLDISDGVLCDEHLRVVGAEDIVAAGTVARWPNLRYSPKPRRVGQWIMALEQGRAAASALLGSDHPARPAALIPRFWSDQFGLRIQVCGEVPGDGSAEMTVSRERPGRRDTARGGVVVGYHRDGEQIGLVAVNAMRTFTTTARMMLAAPLRLVGAEYDGPPMLPPARRPMLTAGPQRALPPAPPPMMPAPAPPMVPAPEPRMLAAAPADLSAPPEPDGYYPAQFPPDQRYAEQYPPPGYEPGYGPGYGPGYEPGYGPGPEPGYGPGYEPGYGPGPEPGYGPGYEPGYGPGPEPGYGPGYEPGYEQPQYEPAGYGPPGYEPAPPHPTDGYEPVGYGPEPGYEPVGYGPEPGYEPMYEPAYGPQFPPEYPPSDYEQYSPDQYGPAPISPPVSLPQYSDDNPPPEYGPPAPPRRSSPRDRFSTDQFAAIR